MEERTSTVDEVMETIRSLGLSGAQCALVEGFAATLAERNGRITPRKPWIEYLKAKPDDGESLKCFLELEGRHSGDFMLADDLIEYEVVTQRLRFEVGRWDPDDIVRVQVLEGLPKDIVIRLLRQILTEIDEHWHTLMRAHLALRGKP